MTIEEMQKKQLIQLLRGDGKYMVENSQYAPGAEITDVGKILSRGIYKVFKHNTGVKMEYEKSLLQMLDQTNFDVYLVCIYMVSQLFKEHNDLSPFMLDKQLILKKLHNEIILRKNDIINGIVYPSGYNNKNAWAELERFNSVCAEEYQIKDSDTVFYFFNPFSVKILSKVLASIKESYYNCNRQRKLIFYYPTLEYVGEIMKYDDFDFIDEIDCSDLYEDKKGRECVMIFGIGEI